MMISEMGNMRGKRILALAGMVAVVFIAHIEAFTPRHKLMFAVRSKTTLLASDQDVEFVKQQLLQKQLEYEQRRRERFEATNPNLDQDEIPSLEQLPMIPYINESGLVSPISGPAGTRATVYAIYDRNNFLQYIGISRNVHQSLRLQLARCPDLTYGVKVQHVSKASKALLELMRDTWIKNSAIPPPGNTDQAVQNLWENPLDVTTVWTPEEAEEFQNGKSLGKDDITMKTIARRYEAKKVEILTARGVKENTRFDPKLKGKGLLDLYTEKAKDEIPAGPPKKSTPK